MPIEKPHVVATSGGVAKVVRENPMVRISSSGLGTIIAQNGRVMWENGTDVDDVPAWFWEQYSQVDPELQKQIGVKPVIKK